MHFFFDELQDYVDFGKQDAVRLNELRPRLEPYFEDIVVHFYQALETNPHTSNIFEDKAQSERLHRTLKIWLREVFTGPYDEAYFQKRLRIGKMHVKVGLQPQFMFGAMNLVRCDILALLKGWDYPAEYHRSVQRILDIELTIMVQSFFDKLLEMKMQIPAALAAGLAHEIRNPLNSIALHMTLLERRMRKIDQASEVVGASIDGVRQELRRLRGLTSEIIDFAKPLEVHPRWCDAKSLLQTLKQVHGPTMEAAKITLNTEIKGEAKIYVDFDRITQALVNLLTNSAEAIELEGQINITIDSNEKGTHLRFEDTGPGLPHDLRFQAFDLFFTTKATGTGMGLPIVQKIVDAHGGSMKVDTLYQDGAAFDIRLPRPTVPTNEHE